MSENTFPMNDWPGPDPGSVPLTRAEVVEQLVEQTGRSSQVAAAMVGDYLDDTSARLGFSVHRWGLDAGDVAEIRRDYEWRDYERGETPADARARAAVNAAGWATTAAAADPEHSPGHAARSDEQAAVWAARAEDGWSA
ncbi:hypothetical protein GCM10010472_30340 [Pseudonocardia halophobica]|uniref:Uncharacterized protein n=1 Tax=Pseudonocardia halophobica TaxID=29401 RepID=A0A9W6KX36_9PSEU|nr:hypothetical protein [Pseudonocardia halophobica]GLL09293.1 hypothetical protein GCM10017577_04330 [Pseudonocardia halophobica]